MFDKIFSLLAIIFVSPIILILSIFIILFDGFPIFFKQKRVGKNGKLFNVYKFRSMVKNAEDTLKNDKDLYQKYINNDYKLEPSEDPRILPIGNFIRKASIDELPQFFNVLKGDMSVVGPRPVVPSELNDLYGDKSIIYTSVKPGITGLWQASGRSELKGEDRVKLDIEGIQKKSFLFDIYIILKTVYVVFTKRGAH